jgi:hypothetical protein
MNNLILKLKPLLGGIVNRCILLLWPDEEGAEETDTRINFEIATEVGNVINLTLGTDSNGQTPIVLNEKVTHQYQWDELPFRENKWKENSFWESIHQISYENFDVSHHRTYSKIVKNRVEQISILYFDDDEKEPTGIALKFSSNIKIFSIPGVIGNAIKTELPMDWFPEKIKMEKIEK